MYWFAGITKNPGDKNRFFAIDFKNFELRCQKNRQHTADNRNPIARQPSEITDGITNN